MTLKKLVEEMISSAYENGYEPEIKNLTDEDLASDIYYYFDLDETKIDEFFTLEEVLAAVKEVRNVH